MNRFYALVLSLILVPIAAAQGYNVIDLGPLSPAAINAQGEVAGNLNGQGYVWTRAGGLQSLGLLPGGTFSIAADINDFGVVAGTADGPGIQAGRHRWVVGASPGMSGFPHFWMPPWSWYPRHVRPGSTP